MVTRQLARVIVGVLILLSALFAPISPAEGQEVPEPATFDGWTIDAETTSGPASAARVAGDGLSLTGELDTGVFAYDNFLRTDTGSSSTGIWDVGSSTETSGSLTFDYRFEGFHGDGAAQVDLLAFVQTLNPDDTVTEELIRLVDLSTSAPFTASGTHTFVLTSGQRYGFRLGGANGGGNGEFSGRLLVGPSGQVNADTVVLNGFDGTRGESGWHLNGAFLGTTRGYLDDPAKFGPAGLSPTDYVIADGLSGATRSDLVGTDAFLVGYVPTTSYTPAENSGLVDFVGDGGVLIATTDDTGHSMASFFGLTQGTGSTNPSTFADPAHPIANGPFGIDATYDEYASIGHYSALGPDAVTVATNAAGQVTMAEIVPGALGPDSGLALFMADVDFFSDTAAGPQFTGAIDNELLIGNLFAYVADSLRPEPDPEPEILADVELLQAIPALDGSLTAAVTVQVVGEAGSTNELDLVTSGSCVDGQIGTTTKVGTLFVTLDANGEAVAEVAVTLSEPLDAYAAIQVEFPGAFPAAAAAAPVKTSPCIIAGPANDSWVRAVEIPLTPGVEVSTGSASGFLDSLGNARWYRFDIQPGARTTVELSSLPADYDLALFTDIAEAFVDVDDVDDLNRLGAEFAPSVFSPSVFSPSVFSPSVFSPDAYAPSVFSPSVFSPSVFSPSVFSPSVFSPSVFSPSVFSPSVFSPSVFSPSVFSPDEYSPSVFSPSVFSPENFASAQTRSLVSMSAQPGTGDEVVVADTWSNTGQFYIRVSGKNGEFDVEDPFDLDITLTGVECAPVVPIPPNGGPQPDAGAYRTLILHDPVRLDPTLIGNDAAARADLETKLAAYAARAEVAGTIIDLGAYPHIVALHDQADANPSCPHAENLLAEAIKDIVDGYRALNPTAQYITIVGSDAQVPFFRYPDQALLGPEQDYVPPVRELTQSQSALRNNFILGQDEYGASRTINLAAGRFPLPGLAVGRLVESATDMNTMLDAYLSTTDGVVDTPESTLVSGYDFLTDAANEVQAELVAGTVGARNDTLITAADISPDDPRSFNADQWRAEVLDEGEDIVFLAGHFSANSALAADYETTALATELAASDVDLWNSFVISPGCHSGYNIVDGDIVPGLTEPLDWTQAFAQKGATLVAGTGYQYGDTDFVEYSERLYVLFARELRRGTGPVSVGEALIRAKQEYLATTPEIRGLHRKSILISTVFGLPNISVDLPGERLPADPTGPPPSLDPVASDPGLTLGLDTADLSVDLAEQLTEGTVELTDLTDPDNPLQARYLVGPDGVVTNPAEPALPLVRQDVTVPGRSLRGVGFRGGPWSETQVVPLTGAPTTELRGVHTPFVSLVNFPMRLATPNYFGALTETGGTTLSITPVQHRVANIGDVEATRRTFSQLDLRLFYSGNTEVYGENFPALAAAPTFSGVQAQRDGDDVVIRARVVGDPSAGIQSVWVTYTDGSGSSGEWVSLDLTQDPDDSTIWTARIVGGGLVGQLDMIVQAVNGVGLVTVDDNFGAYYSIQGEVGEEPPPPPAETALAIGAPATTFFGDTITLSATLTSDGSPVADETVLFSLGGAGQVGTTDGTGTASVDLPINVNPGTYTLVTSFVGDGTLEPSSTSIEVVVEEASTSIELELSGDAGDLAVLATLTDGQGTPLLQRTVVVTIDGAEGLTQAARITDNLGRIRFGPEAVPGAETITASFDGGTVYAPSSATADVPPAGPMCNGVPATIVGTDRGERINGTTGDDVIVALGGNDTIYGRGGDDLICAGSGNDRVFAGQGDDVIFGEDGVDKLNGQVGNDTIDGGAGKDNVNGGGGDDVLAGGADNDRVYGGSGQDDLSGDGGNDQLFGGSGNDEMSGGDGNDRLVGGSGNDTGDGGQGVDKVQGSSGDDVLEGGTENDNLDGGGGADELSGGDGDDVIRGRSGNDTLDGGLGTDTLKGDGGIDTCTTGEILTSCEV